MTRVSPRKFPQWGPSYPHYPQEPVGKYSCNISSQSTILMSPLSHQCDKGVVEGNRGSVGIFVGAKFVENHAPDTFIPCISTTAPTASWKLVDRSSCRPPACFTQGSSSPFWARLINAPASRRCVCTNPHPEKKGWGFYSRLEPEERESLDCLVPDQLRMHFAPEPTWQLVCIVRAERVSALPGGADVPGVLQLSEVDNLPPGGGNRDLKGPKLAEAGPVQGDFAAAKRERPEIEEEA